MVRDERVKQVAVALSIIGVVVLAFAGVWLGRFLPGVAGEWFERILGILTTPFLMEGFILVAGFFLIYGLNLWRQHREGDEFVYLDEVKDPPANLPDQARWAIYREAPLENAEPTALDQLEGALAIADHSQAKELLAAMSNEERNTPAVLALRAQLARATGQEDLAWRLEQQLAQSQSESQPQNPPPRPEAES